MLSGLENTISIGTGGKSWVRNERRRRNESPSKETGSPSTSVVVHITISYSRVSFDVFSIVIVLTNRSSVDTSRTSESFSDLSAVT